MNQSENSVAQTPENASNQQKPVQHHTPYWDIGRLILSLVLCTAVVLAVVALEKCG